MKDEIQKIRKKFMKADYPRSFVNSVTSLYNNKIKKQKIDNDEDYIIPPYLFEHKKPFTLLKLLFREQNELKPKNFIERFHKFTNDNFWLHSISTPPPLPPPKKMIAWGDLNKFLPWIIAWGHTMYIVQKQSF